MPNLTVWAYDTPLGAQAGELRLKSLEQRGAVTVEDAITVAWMPGAPQPRVGHLLQASSVSAGRGSVLGALVGMLALAPAAGTAAGAGIAAVAQRLRGTGINQRFLEETVALLDPGSSVLLVSRRALISTLCDRLSSVASHVATPSSSTPNSPRTRLMPSAT